MAKTNKTGTIEEGANQVESLASSIMNKMYAQMFMKICLPEIIKFEDRTRAVSSLAKIHHVQYMEKEVKEKKVNCIACKQNFENIFILILHIELQHGDSRKRQPYVVEKYELEGDLMRIFLQKPNQFEDNEKMNLVMPYPNHIYVFGSMGYRLNVILNHCLTKIIKKNQLVGQKLYFHSHNIFQRIG